VKSRLASGLLCCFPFFAFGQDSPQQPPPAQQPPPTKQPPPTAPGTPATPKPTVILPPQQPGQPSKAPPPERDTGGDSLSIMPFYFDTTNQPRLRQGIASTATQNGSLNFPGSRKYGYGGVLTIPTGHENSLQFTYFRRQDHGNALLGVDSSYFGTVFTNGDALNTRYTLQTMKLSWNYLTYPYPSAGAKFRFKTLWEVQYVTMLSDFDAPADVNATATEGRKSLVLPTLGVGIEYHLAKHFFVEVKGSGFDIPHHADIWDTEANAVIRAGRIEVVVGGKAFHFKTSPQAADNYFFETLYGPYGGLRYIFR